MTKNESTETKKEQFVKVAEQIVYNSESAKESVLEFSQNMSQIVDSLSERINKSYEKIKLSYDEYEDIFTYVDSSDWARVADVTFDELTEMTIGDVVERIRELRGVITPDSEWATKNISPTFENALSLAKPKRIENYFITIDKVSQAISRGIIENGDIDFPVYMTNDQRYQAIVSMEFLNLPNVETSENFNYFEWQVHNAIVSLALDNDWFTDYMIYEVVARTYYNKADANPSEETLQEIRDIVNKIINCRITINTTKDTPLKNEELRSLEGFLISADKETRLLNGRVREGYLINRNSLAYYYASTKGQVITVPLKLLHTSLRFSKETSILKEYLVQRIALMKNEKNKIKSRDILYETAFEYIPFTQKTPRAVANKKSKLRGFAVTMLEELKNEGFIKNYNVQKKDRITIQL